MLFAMMGMGSYSSGGFSNPPAVNYCCAACFAVGFLLLAVAVWYLRRAPELDTAHLPASEAPRQ